MPYFYFGISLLLLGFLIYQIKYGSPNGFMRPLPANMLGILLAAIIFKLVVAVGLLVEDAWRLISRSIHFLFSKEEVPHLPSRRAFISKIALGVAAIPFTSLLYGMYKGKYNFRIHNQTLFFKTLPQEFDGFTILQISDLHVGSFTNYERVEEAVKLIQAQHKDIIVFTGDLVNNRADEMQPWKTLFTTLKAPEGVYSILGNHDYGDYIQWPSTTAKTKNLEALKTIHSEMGWDLLCNTSRTLTRGNAVLEIVGVENWGKGSFKKAGDLNQALKHTSQEGFKILLSHDPSHWDLQVKTHSTNIPLTLSGHTHGMQFGIEIPGIVKWSPVKYRYPQWAGLYTFQDKHLYVNRGLGYIGYSGRVGIWPEITSITLKKASN